MTNYIITVKCWRTRLKLFGSPILNIQAKETDKPKKVLVDWLKNYLDDSISYAELKVSKSQADFILYNKNKNKHYYYRWN